MGMATQPVLDKMLGEPAPPANDQHRLHDELDHRAGDEDEGPGREHEQEKTPERGFVLVLDGIEQVTAKEAEPDVDADLNLVDEDQEHYHADRDAPFEGRVGGKRPDARLAVLGRLVIEVCNTGDLPYHSDIRARIWE